MRIFVGRDVEKNFPRDVKNRVVVDVIDYVLPMSAETLNYVLLACDELTERQHIAILLCENLLKNHRINQH